MANSSLRSWWTSSSRSRPAMRGSQGAPTSYVNERAPSVYVCVGGSLQSIRVCIMIPQAAAAHACVVSLAS